MYPATDSNESIPSDRSADIVYTDHPSRRRKEQISGSKNAQTEYESYLSQKDAHLSTYGPTTSSARHITNHKGRIDTKVEDRSNPKHSKITEQKHKGTDTQDVDSLRRPETEDDETEDDETEDKFCVRLCLFCVRFCKREKYPKLNLKKPTIRFLERIKKRSKECEKSDKTATTVSAAPYQDSISRALEKPERSRKHEAEEVADRDPSERAGIERKERKERKKRKKEEQKRKERKEKERKERRERRKREELISRAVDAHLVTHDEDFIVVDHVARKPPTTDFTKTCCYLCAQNTLAITAATLKPEQSDKCIQVSAHKFRTEMPTLDKTCSPILLVRTVQSSVKVRTREISTLCPGTSVRRKGTKTRTKSKKFSVFSRLTRTKCPAGRHAACETDKSSKRDNVEKREPRNEKCCREKNV